MANKAKITKESYDNIKAMLKAKMTITRIANILDVAPCTVSRVAKSNSMEEYFQTRREKSNARKKNEEPAKAVQDPTHTVVVQASHYMLEEQKKTNELLTLISNKLAVIISDLYGVKE